MRFMETSASKLLQPCHLNHNNLRNNLGITIIKDAPHTSSSKIKQILHNNAS
jgi:hypothetical protein